MDEEAIFRIAHNCVVYLLQYDCQLNKKVKRVQLHFLTGDGQLLKQKAIGFQSREYHFQIYQCSKGGSVFPAIGILLRGEVPRKIQESGNKALRWQEPREVQRQGWSVGSTSKHHRGQRLVKQEPLSNKTVFRKPTWQIN